ncbi:flagellar hook-length control protein FliK [Evansella caseinilytica]|uniref:Flagellar hook-length control protein FliK n=1 Tax=Evansella caseinilytica TaxID=1503961 RepID=A0A1H3M5K7_9BACI|nr:flagellar hook-length control protein FliK [Evansella caseinilytica]SDY72010.1 flagellar hook-length control protein FliK [Evansella caseinilytica]
MSGMMLPIQPAVQSNGNNGSLNSRRTGFNNETPFKNILQSSLNGGRAGIMDYPSNSQAEGSASIVAAPENMLLLFTQLAEVVLQLSDESSYLDEELLSSDWVQQMLEALPDEAGEKIRALFQGNLSLEELLNQFQTDPSCLLAFMIAAGYYEQQHGERGEGLHNILPIIDKAFQHFSIPETAGVKSWQELAEKLIVQPADSLVKGTNENRQVTARDWISKLTERQGEKVLQAAAQSVVQQKDTNSSGTNVHFGNQYMSRLQQLMLHNGDKQGDKVTEQQVLRQFEQALGRSQFQQLGNGLQQLTLKLHPQSLGRVDITVQQVNGVLVAKLMTTTSLAKEMIEGHLQQLRHAFHGQQIQVDRIEVTQQQQAQQQQLRDQHSDGQQPDGKQHADEEQNDEDVNEEELFSAFLAETINTEA